MSLGYDQKIIEKAKKENKEFNCLYIKHEQFKKRLKDIDKVAYLNADQEMERKRIQKLKLYNKDKMARILNEFSINNIKM